MPKMIAPFGERELERLFPKIYHVPWNPWKFPRKLNHGILRNTMCWGTEERKKQRNKGTNSVKINKTTLHWPGLEGHWHQPKYFVQSILKNLDQRGFDIDQGQTMTLPVEGKWNWILIRHKGIHMTQYMEIVVLEPYLSLIVISFGLDVHVVNGKEQCFVDNVLECLTPGRVPRQLYGDMALHPHSERMM